MLIQTKSNHLHHHNYALRLDSCGNPRRGCFSNWWSCGWWWCIYETLKSEGMSAPADFLARALGLEAQPSFLSLPPCIRAQFAGVTLVGVSHQWKIPCCRLVEFQMFHLKGRISPESFRCSGHSPGRLLFLRTVHARLRQNTCRIDLLACRFSTPWWNQIHWLDLAQRNKMCCCSHVPNELAAFVPLQWLRQAKPSSSLRWCRGINHLCIGWQSIVRPQICSSDRARLRS